MAGRIRDFDWASTPLGPIAGWPQSLKTIVDLMLRSPSMMSLVWGAEAIHLYNDSFSTLLREHRSPFLGRSARETFARSKGVFTDDLAAGMAGQSARQSDRRHPVLRDGRLQDAWFDAEYVPVHDDPGVVGGVLWTLRETTQQHVSEGAIRASETRHRLLVESWAQAVWETDPEGVVVADSPSWRAYTGQTLGEWLGYGWLNAIHPDDRAYAERQWREAIAARGPVDAEFRLRSPGGGWLWTNVRAVPMLDGAGAVERWIGLNIHIDKRKQAEEALRTSEEKYRTLFDTMDQGYSLNEIVRDAEGRAIDIRYIELNPALERLTGVPAREATGRLASEVFPGLDRFWIDVVDRVVTSGIAEQVEHELNPVGRWYQSKLRAIGGGRCVSLFDDITERKKAEAARRESEERQAFLLKLSDALRAEADPDALGSLATRMLGEHLGADRCWISRISHEEGLSRLGPEYRRNDLAPVSGEYALADFPVSVRQSETVFSLVSDDVADDGALSALDKAGYKAMGVGAHVSAILRRGERNSIWGLSVGFSAPRAWTAAEVALVEEAAERIWAATERARADAALRESEARFRQFAQASASGLWIRDAQTLKMEYASPAISRIYGVDLETFLHGVEVWASSIVPEDRDLALRHIEQARSGEAVTHEFRIQRVSDQIFRWIRNTDFPLLGGRGEVTRIGGIADDVTDAKLAAEHSAVLLAELQHRVRNIMALLRSITTRTAERAESVPDYRDLMMGRLLAFARVQALLTRTAGTSVDIASLVHDEISAQSQHEGQYVLDGSPVALSPKAAEVLTLAIHELATNAVKYGALSVPTGRVTVRWSTLEKRGGPWLAFDWTEEGGPARPQLTPETPQRRGFGSELITRRIPYELRGRGELDIASGGARCHLEFPLEGGASVLETDAPQRATVFGGAIDMTGEADLTGRRVLVVEDDYYLATDAARALRGAGAEVMGPCATEEDARAELAEGRPDAVVVDINLGAGPSFKLAEALQDRGIPFVFTTGYDAGVIPAEFEAVERLEKPLQLRRIVGAVATLTAAA